jgi:hypothetical protein
METKKPFPWAEVVCPIVEVEVIVLVVVEAVPETTACPVTVTV